MHNDPPITKLMLNIDFASSIPNELTAFFNGEYPSGTERIAAVITKIIDTNVPKNPNKISNLSSDFATITIPL